MIAILYGTVWSESEKYLYEFNKTIITLASSTLVLSFSIIQFLKSPIDKNNLVMSWIILVLALVIGVMLYFFRFIIAIAFEKVKPKGSILRDDFFKHKDAVAYALLINASFILGILQLILFVLGIALLMLSAFNSL